MSICLDYAEALGAVSDKEGNLHWPRADASNFDVSRLKFCPHCRQPLPRQDGIFIPTTEIHVEVPPLRKRGRPRKYASNAEKQAAYRRRKA